MILDRDRKLCWLLFKLRLFYFQPVMFNYQIYARPGAQWIFDWMRRRQTRDGLHHAPACPGNEWDGMALVYRRCNCGAERYNILKRG